MTALLLTLDATSYRPGERVTGTVQLDLPAPAPAKRLVVGLMARQRAVGLPPHQGLALSYRNDKVWEFELQLDGPRRYRPGETARFELLIPLEAEGELPGDVAKALSELSNVKRFPLEWRVFAVLERPWQINPKGEVRLPLAAAETQPTPPAPPKRGARKPAPAKKKAAAKRKR
ncbi:MAG: hypothetical protein Q8N23_22215 [Archangium sp.]|nr:hypothetical protein [Archangium sp.]MDP3573738.1 hypothetical protein [Archangium sp.]